MSIVVVCPVKDIECRSIICGGAMGCQIERRAKPDYGLVDRLKEQDRYNARHYVRDPLHEEAVHALEAQAKRIAELEAALEKAKVLIGASNDRLPLAVRESNINQAWWVLDQALGKAIS